MKITFFKQRLIAAIVLTAVLGASLFISAPIEKLLGLAPIMVEQDFQSTSDLAEDIETVKLGEAVMHFIDVGQGDATLIELPSETELTDDGGAVEGTVILIDGGSGASKNKPKAEDGNLKLLNYLEERFSGVPNFIFDYVILTHADEDHCGGLDDVLLEYGAQVIYRPNQKSTYRDYTDPALSLSAPERLYGGLLAKNNVDTKVYKDFLTVAYQNRIGGNGSTKKVFVTDATKPEISTIEGSRVYDDGGNREVSKGDSEYFEIKFHTPTNDAYTDKNNYSPVLTLDFNDKRVVLTGDAEKEAEEEFYDLNKDNPFFDKKADIIKAGHHGSHTSTSSKLLDVVVSKTSNASTLAVFSCGLDNEYRHPRQETIDRLLDYGFKEENLLRTDINGDIVISFVPDTENAGRYMMMFGASVIRSEQEPPLNIKWWQVAIGLWVLGMLVIFTLNINKKSGKVTVGAGSGKKSVTIPAAKSSKKSPARKTTKKKSSGSKKK